MFSFHSALRLRLVFAGIPEGETNNAELIAPRWTAKQLVCGRCVGDGAAHDHARALARRVPSRFSAAIDAQKPDLVLALLGTDARADALRRAFGVNWRKGRDAGDTPE